MRNEFNVVPLTEQDPCPLCNQMGLEAIVSKVKYKGKSFLNEPGMHCSNCDQVFRTSEQMRRWEDGEHSAQEADAIFLDRFFDFLVEAGNYQFELSDHFPTEIHINPALLQRLSTKIGFFQRPEMGTEVTVYSPVVSRMKFSWGVVKIIEDYDLDFLYFQ